MHDMTPKKESPAPLISIIIVSYNSLDYLQSFFASLGVYPPEDRYEIILVDNASSDDTAQWCLYAPLDLQLVINHENLGFAAASNTGAKLARGEFLLFCNPDVRWTSPVADRLIEFLREHPTCGAATARMTSADGSFQPTCRRFPTFTNIWFSRGSFLSRLYNPTKRPFLYTLPEYDCPSCVDATAGTCLMVPKRVFDLVDGFDQRFFLFVEDTDLCRRLADAGYETWFVPQATAIHYGGGSSKDHRTVSRHHRESILKYFKKHYPRARLRNLLLSFFLSLAGKIPGTQRSRT